MHEGCTRLSYGGGWVMKGGGGGLPIIVPSRVWTALNHIRVMNVGGKLNGCLDILKIIV